MNASIGAATVSATGALTVAADTSGRSHAKASGGDGGAAGISIINANASTTVTTSAGIGPGATITNAASIGVTAQRGGIAGQTETTFGEILVAGVGFISGAGGKGEATDSGAVTATIGDNAAVTASGSVQVVAISVTSTKGDARGGTGAAVAVVVPEAAATHSATTSAAVGSNTGVTGASLDVVSSATTVVRVDALTVGIGLAGGAGQGDGAVVWDDRGSHRARLRHQLACQPAAEHRERCGGGPGGRFPDGGRRRQGRHWRSDRDRRVDRRGPARWLQPGLHRQRRPSASR